MSSTLKKPLEGSDKSQARLKKISDSYQTFQAQKIRSDNLIYTEHNEALKNYQDQIKKLEEIIRGYKDKGQKYLKELKNKVSGFETQKLKYQKILNEFEKGVKNQNQQINRHRNQYVNKIKQRITIAQSININSIINLQLDDRRSQSHELFRWILLIFYKQPISKYYWDNFKQQIYQQDKGYDFKQRLGKIPSHETKQEEKLLTEKLLQKRQKLLNHPDFSNINSQIQKIFNIARLYLQGFIVSKSIKQKQILIAKTKDQRIQKQQMFKKAQNKRDQLEQRVRINEKFISLLQSIENKLNQKQRIYSEIIVESVKILQDYKNMEKGILNPVQKKYFEDIQKRDNLKCSIF